MEYLYVPPYIKCKYYFKIKIQLERLTCQKYARACIAYVKIQIKKNIVSNDFFLIRNHNKNIVILLLKKS